METPKKIVVIGSGMGGLVTALILAKHGYQVKVLEKNHQVGGSLQVFSRDKRIFDTGVHYVGGLDKGENLYQIFKYLNVLDDLDLHRMDEHGYDVIRLANSQEIKHGIGYVNFEEELKKSFPDNHQDIVVICAEIQKFCGYFPLYNLEMDSITNYIENSEVLEIGAWEHLSTLTDNEDLIKAILGSGPLYAGIRGITPFYVMALILNSFVKGSYRFVNGASQIAKILMRRISEHGGEVLRRKEVVSTTFFEDGSIRSVICADGSEFECDSVISNLHPLETISIVGENNFKNPYVKRLKSLTNTTSTFMVYVSFKEDTFPYLNSNFYDYFTENIWKEEFEFNEEWPQMTFTSAQVSKNTDQFAESISIMCYLDFKEFEKWGESVKTIIVEGERHVDYDAFKQLCVDRVMKRIESRFPGITKNIRNIYSSSPVTYRDYIATPNGSMYGFQKDFNQIHKSQINTKTHVPNLYLTGQNIIFHGILGATIGALVTSFNFVDNKEVIEKIKNYD